ncbi:MAG TPA: WYL domain-containing transcriptional regulator [Gemmataceae bacterium]|nr:WYL domain-containing transcriptional regulator [Gemmataceae bacterium]
MRTASRPPLRRLLALDRMIRSGSFPNARTAAAELEVHRRTVLRDLDFLRDFWGAPVEFCVRRNGYFYRDADYALPLLRLTEGELVALFLAERVMHQYRGTPYERDLAGAFFKLTSRLPEEVTVDLSHLDEWVSFRPAGVGAEDVRRFRRLMRAVREGRQLRLEYWTASRDEVTPRVVDPYHLTSVAGDWYLVAYCHLREDVRMFVPGRIRSMRETGARFERPADFRIEEYLDGSFRAMRGDGKPRRVRLRFTAEAARWIREKEWHPSQRLRDRADGGVELTLRLTHLQEVKRWALSYGAACEVLEPADLRRATKEEMEKALSGYRN